MMRIENQGVTVDVTPETVRSKINRQIITRKIYLSYTEIAETLGYVAEDMLQPLIECGALGVRITVITGEIDFEFITHHDNVKMMADKFNAYLDSAYLGLVEAIINALNSLDAPHDPDLTAGALPEDTEKKS